LDKLHNILHITQSTKAKTINVENENVTKIKSRKMTKNKHENCGKHKVISL